MNKILKKKRLNDTVVMMEFSAKMIAEKCCPGQFVILRVGQNGERIPLTIFDFNKVDGTISIIYQIVGATTMKLDKLVEGDFILDVVGPLGMATDLDNIKSAIVIGGGVGCAIGFPIVKKLHQINVDVTSIIGFRNKDLIILEEEFKMYSKKTIIMTDDGSYGEKGLVTNSLKDLLDNGKYDKVFAIGPLIMMKYVALLTKEYAQPTIVSMNPIMIDGTGMCGCCRVSCNGETKFACVDGPDFNAHLIDFDEAIARNSTYTEFERKKREETCNLYKMVEKNEN